MLPMLPMQMLLVLPMLPMPLLQRMCLAAVGLARLSPLSTTAAERPRRRLTSLVRVLWVGIRRAATDSPLLQPRALRMIVPGRRPEDTTCSRTMLRLRGRTLMRSPRPLRPLSLLSLLIPLRPTPSCTG